MRIAKGCLGLTAALVLLAAAAASVAQPIAAPALPAFGLEFQELRELPGGGESSPDVSPALRSLASPPGEAAAGDEPLDEGPDGEMPLPPEALSGTFGAAAGPSTGAPNMIGDSGQAHGLPNPSAGGGVGRVKIAENNSPWPRDRFFFDYAFFDNVPVFPGGIQMHRYLLGFEKTFCCGRISFQIDIPMATTLDSTVFADDGFVPAAGDFGPMALTSNGTDLSNGEFGNLVFTFKALMVKSRTFGIVGGVRVSVPTADDLYVKLVDGTTLAKVPNEAVHVAPYLGALWAPDDCFFAQGFIQVDAESNRNDVLMDTGNGLERFGELPEPTFLFVDVGVGRWVYRDDCARRGLTGLALAAELHWSLALNEADGVLAGGFQVGGIAAGAGYTNLTLAAHFELRRRTRLTVAYAAPIEGRPEQLFDGELRIIINRHFGPDSLLNRVPSL